MERDSKRRNTEKRSGMNGEAWEKERRFFTRMEEKQHTNTTKPDHPLYLRYDPSVP